MKYKATPLFSKFIADDIRDHFSVDSNTYIGIGRSLDFGSLSANIEPVNFTTNKLNQLYRNLVALKKISASDMQIVAARQDWATGIKYDAYEDDVDLYLFDKVTNLGTVNSNADTILVGTVSINGSNTVTGSGTTFTSYLFAGDQVSVNGSTKTVVSVPTNSLLIVDSAFANTNASQTITLVKNNKTIIANSASFMGSLSTGNVVIIGEDSREVIAVRSNKVIAVNSALTYSNSNVAIYRKDNTYPLYANNFYVRNSRDQVFKCLFNNSGVNSTVEPTIDIDGQLPENQFISTSDGYKWKYLYTIPPGLKQKFFTDKWMPVSNDSSVLASSTEGRIDIINVLWGGSGHIGGGNSNTSRILTVTNTDGANANLSCRVSNGVITSVVILNGGNNYTTGVVSVTDNDKLGTIPLGGTVNVTSGSSTVSANLSNYQRFLGNVFTNDIVTINNESRNVVTVVSDTSLTVNQAFTYTATSQVATITRSSAVFDIEFSPKGGHGSFPGRELGARSLMISVEFDGTENDTIPISDVVNSNNFDFNQISIIQDPLIANGAFFANAANYRMSTRVLVSDPGISNFSNDETIYIGTSLASATMVANAVHWSPADNYLYINNITGPFSVSDLVRGNTSGTVATVLDIANSQAKLFSGDVLYIENRKNVVRDEDQIEQSKIVLTF